MARGRLGSGGHCEQLRGLMGFPGTMRQAQDFPLPPYTSGTARTGSPPPLLLPYLPTTSKSRISCLLLVIRAGSARRLPGSSWFPSPPKPSSAYQRCVWGVGGSQEASGTTWATWEASDSKVFPGLIAEGITSPGAFSLSFCPFSGAFLSPSGHGLLGCGGRGALCFCQPRVHSGAPFQR